MVRCRSHAGLYDDDGWNRRRARRVLDVSGLMSATLVLEPAVLRTCSRARGVDRGRQGGGDPDEDDVLAEVTPADDIFRAPPLRQPQHHRSGVGDVRGLSSVGPRVAVTLLGLPAHIPPAPKGPRAAVMSRRMPSTSYAVAYEPCNGNARTGCIVNPYS